LAVVCGCGVWLYSFAVAFGCDNYDYGINVSCGIVISCGVLHRLWRYHQLWHFVDFAAAFAVLEDTIFVKNTFHG